MKKFLVLVLLLVLASPVFAANWVEFFEKKYIDTESVTVDENLKRVKFWVKDLRKDPKEKFPDYSGKMVDYWYSMNLFNMDCENKRVRIESYIVYDLKQKLIYSDDTVPEWHNIIPDTYGDGYYRLFCIAPFEQNPLTNH